MTAVLQGLRVIELGQVFAGPFAGAILSDLGAEVIKVERVQGGDDARRMGPAYLRGDALNFHIFNRGKQSVALDLKSQSGRDALSRLLSQADVFVHNLRPGVAEQLGVDAKSLTARHPQLIYAEISAYGSAGPLAHQPGYEPLMQAFSGLSSLNGGEGDAPMRSATSLCDQGSGMWLVIGILSLLHRRHQTGKGGVVQSSLLETAMMWNAQKSDAWINEGRLPERHRSGHPGFVPYEAFDTADLPILICCGNDRLFAKLTLALDQPQWAHDARFATNRDRLAHKAQLIAQIQTVLGQRGRDEWLQRFEQAGVPAAAIHALEQALAHPQLQAQQMWAAVPQDGFQLTALPLRLDGARPAITGPAPALGESNLRHGCPLPSTSLPNEAP